MGTGSSAERLRKPGSSQSRVHNVSPADQNKVLGLGAHRSGHSVRSDSHLALDPRFS